MNRRQLIEGYRVYKKGGVVSRKLLDALYIKIFPNYFSLLLIKSEVEFYNNKHVVNNFIEYKGMRRRLLYCIAALIVTIAISFINKC